MDLRQSLRNLVLGNDREKHLPEELKGKFLYYFRYYYLQIFGWNLLFVLCCLPVVTIPAACCGLSGVMVKLVREKVVHPGKDFFLEFKTDFFRRLLLWGLLCIVPLSLGFYAQVLGLERDGTVTRLISILVVFLIQRYWYVCMVLIEATPWQNLKNAVLLMAVEWKKTMSLLATVGVMYGSCFLFPLYGFPVMVLCLFALCHLLTAILLTPSALQHLDQSQQQ